MHLFIVETLIVGFCFRNSGSVGMHGSPAPAVTASESLISIQFYKSFSARESDGPGAGSVKYVVVLFLFYFIIFGMSSEKYYLFHASYSILEE